MSTLESIFWHVLGYTAVPAIFIFGFLAVAAGVFVGFIAGAGQGFLVSVPRH